MKANGDEDDKEDTIQGAQRSDSANKKGPNDLLAEGGTFSEWTEFIIKLTNSI